MQSQPALCINCESYLHPVHFTRHSSACLRPSKEVLVGDIFGLKLERLKDALLNRKNKFYLRGIELIDQLLEE